MEDPILRPGFPGDRSQAAAEKLRALRERANQALEGHRTRFGEIEAKLSERVRQLAEEFGATLDAQGPVNDGREDELAVLRRQVEEANAKHEKFVEQLVGARKQLDAIQSQPCASCQQAAQQLATADEELRRLHEQLEAATREQEEGRARHEKFVEQLAAARQAITVLQHAAGNSTAEIRAELEAMRLAKSTADDQLSAALRDLTAVNGECDALRVRAASVERELEIKKREALALDEQAKSLDQDRGASAIETTQLRAQVESLAAQLADAERARDELVAQHAAAEGQQQTLAASLANLEAQQAAAQAQQAATQAEQAGLVEMLATAEAETQEALRQLTSSESARLTLGLSLAQSESVCEEYQSRLAAVEEELASLRAQEAAGGAAPELQSQLEKAQAAVAERAQAVSEISRALDEARQELASLRNLMVPIADLEAARGECQAAQSSIFELQGAVADSQAELAKVQADVAAVRAASRPVEEFAALQQKFDLALADVQKLKRENSGLREELATPPDASNLQSPELFALRAERDALTARVRELEAAAASPVVDGDAQQEREDIQRRFEMAVDDVRQLKQENAELRTKLAAGSANADDPALAQGAGDWASQRARLMALLEEEDQHGAINSDRAAERATVQRTITATDRVIANKDQEIAELRAALEARGDATADHEAAALRDEMLGSDEVIAAERVRLAALAAEWESKLRSAELEFSVERAKLAREQAALRERLLELPSVPDPADAEPVDVSKPRRRWLSALGIQEDPADPKKNKR